MQLSSNQLAAMFFEHRGKIVDKWEQYLAIYAREMAPFIQAGRPVRLLEIGVQNGGSLELWLKYLPQGSEVIGIDIDPKVGTLKFHGAIAAYVADATNLAEVSAILADKTFDIIVDDGSHYSIDIISAFKLLYERLVYGGKFIIEDLHASYWRIMGGGLRSSTSAVEFFKHLVDGLNADHFEADAAVSPEELEDLRSYNRSLARICFYDSVAVVEKLTFKKQLSYRRVLSGSESRIVDPFIGIAELPLARIEPLLFSEELKHRIEAKFLDWFSSSRSLIASLKATIADLQAQIERADTLHADSTAEGHRRISELEAEIAARTGVISDLETKVSEQDQTLIALTNAVAQFEADRDRDAFAETPQREVEHVVGKEAVPRCDAKQEKPLQSPPHLAVDHDPPDANKSSDARHQPATTAMSSVIWRDQEIAELQQRIALLQASVSWRATEPLRQIGVRLPVPVRSRLRQAAKLAYWCATLTVGTKVTQKWQMARRRKVIAGPPPFDAAWYLKRYPDVAHVGMDPLEHYLAFGLAEGRIPASGAPPMRLYSRLGRFADRVSGGYARKLWTKARLTPQAVPQPRNNHIATPSQTWHLRELCDPHRQEFVSAPGDPAFQISVLTPTYNSEPYYLKELFQSLLNQQYPNWEWVVVDDGSSNPGTISTLRACAAADPRVRLTLSPVNKGISAATNIALNDASGNYAALVDHDDLIARDAFLQLYQSWQASPDIDLFYTDECKLYPDGTLGEFWPKPDWSPAYLENTMCIGHLSVYKLNLIKKVGGFRTAFDGTQDYDLVLRISLLEPKVQHLPIFGYLWRAIPGSAAVSLDQKHYAIERQARAVLEYAQSKDPAAVVTPGWGAGYWRITYPLPAPCPLLSYVIPTGGGSRLVRGQNVDLVTNCIRSLEATNFYPNREYIVIHNGNLSQTQVDALMALPNVHLIHYQNTLFNFSEKLNLGVRHAKGEYLCLINDDVEALTPRGAEQLVAYLHVNPKVGVIGPLCRLEDDSTQQNGIVLTAVGPAHAGAGQPWNFGGHQAMLRCRREAFAIGGAVMFIKKAVFEELGGYAEDLPLNYNDVDFCLRLRDHGYTCIVDPDISVYHYESATKTGTCAVEQERLFVRHPTMRDGFFSDWFEHGNTNYKLRLPLRNTEDFHFGNWLDRHIGHRASTLSATGKWKLSVCVSVYNQSKQLLREMYTSVMMQTYTNWELVIVDNGSSNPETLDWLNGTRQEARAVVVRLEENAGIIGGNRALLANMTGDFMVPMDADDFLTVDALQIMANAIENHPEAAVFYSDEFKSDMASTRFAPFFKPDFDPVLLTNCCYPAHLMTISRKFLETIRAYDDDAATWCHDYDTLTRTIVAGQEPVHVRELVYAWRINPGSTASAETGAKPETVASQTYVLNRFLRERGLTDVLELGPNERNSGMWQLNAIQPLPNVSLLDAAAIWGDAGSGLAGLIAAASEPHVEWLAIMLSPISSDDVLKLSAPAWLDRRVSAVSGLLLGKDGQHISWSGGFFSAEGSVLDPNAGVSIAAGGYHGQLWCQRCVDVPAPVNLLVRSSAVIHAAARLPTNAGADAFAVMLGLAAHEAGDLVAVTPLLCAAVPSALTIPLPLDRAGLASEFTGLGKGSRWYDGRLSIDDPYAVTSRFEIGSAKAAPLEDRQPPSPAVASIR